VSLPGEFSPATRPSEQAQAANLGTWWQTFHDPTLNRLVARGIAVNYDVQLAEARVLQARAQVRYVRGGLFPDLAASGTYQRITGSNTLSNASVTNSRGSSGSSGSSNSSSSSGRVSSGTVFTSGTTNYYQAGFDAAWELDVFGATRRQIESAQASLQAQIEARRDALVTLISEVANDYVLLRGYQRELKIARDNAEAQEHTLGLERELQGVGLDTGLTIAEEQAQVASTESAIPPLRTSVEQMVEALSVLLNEPAPQLRKELGEMGPVPMGPARIPPGLPADLLRRRPDVREAERNLAAATANIGAATALWFPQFSLTGSLGLESTSLRKLVDRSSIFDAAGPSVSWDIFDAGELQAYIDVQNALQKQALVQYRQAVMQSLADVNNALTAFYSEQDHRRLLQTEVAANQRSVALSQKLYKAGLVDFLTVLTAQQALYQSEDQLQQSEQTVSTDLIALYKALGGGWEGSEKSAVTAADASLGSGE
jgi:NodT family efflux transporter outer membrane factor (OMF) lipoprotein